MQIPSDTQSTEETIQSAKFGRTGWLILAALTISALVMRFWRLGDVPPGLFYDEAFNGLDAHHLVATPLWQWPVFFTGNHGREPLLVWLMGISHFFFGQSIWTIRFVPALCGALLTPALTWLAWEVAPHLGVRNRRAFALWSGAIILALLWSQIFSRYGIRLSLFVLLETLLWASLWKAWGRQTTDDRRQTTGDGRSRQFTESHIPRSPIPWLLAGLFAGLSFYTYLPARLLPLILLPMAVVALWRERGRVFANLRGIGLGALTALIVAAPLGIYFVQNPVSFTTRIGQVSVVGREDEGILANVEPVAGMFGWTGDHNPRSNIPFRPALDLLLAPFFALGIVLALRRFWRLAHIWLLVGLIVMLLPTLLSEFAPNYQRAIGALPFVVIAVALGMEGVVRLAERIFAQGRLPAVGLGSLVIAASIVLTWQAYFVTWAESPNLYAAWDVGFTRLAENIVENDRGVRVYVSPRGQDHPTLGYLLEQYPDTPMPEGFDGRICMRVATNVEARYYFLNNEDPRGKAVVDSYYPAADASPVIWDSTGAAWADTLRQPADGGVVFPEMIEQRAELSDGIALLGYFLFPDQGFNAGDRLYTRLFWQVTASPAGNYTAFSHLVHIDENGAFTQLAGQDRPPGEGTCPTQDWLPGEIVVDELQFVVPDPLPEGGNLYLEVGFYDAAGVRLDVPESENDLVLIPIP
ncbi:hypothetical protein GC175_26850 [bacterium]|nr:hypothetical protein [bacterium]